jgi:hypothetical protein
MADSKTTLRNHTKNSLTQREAGILSLLLGKFASSPKPTGFDRDGKAVRLVRENVAAFAGAVAAELAPPVEEADTDSAAE